MAEAEFEVVADLLRKPFSRRTLMAIERNLLLEVKRTGGLHDRVINVFLKKERRMDFVFK